MEKLIELLSKAKPLAPGFWWDVRNNGAMIISKEEKNNGHSGEICFAKKEELCGKEYGFIKWLVENDKIDFDNRELKDKFMEEFERYPTFHNNTYNQDFNINGLLMLLAISDTPIEDLISYLR